MYPWIQFPIFAFSQSVSVSASFKWKRYCNHNKLCWELQFHSKDLIGTLLNRLLLLPLALFKRPLSISRCIISSCSYFIFLSILRTVIAINHSTSLRHSNSPNRRKPVTLVRDPPPPPNSHSHSISQLHASTPGKRTVQQNERVTDLWPSSACHQQSMSGFGKIFNIRRVFLVIKGHVIAMAARRDLQRGFSGLNDIIRRASVVNGELARSSTSRLLSSLALLELNTPLFFWRQDFKALSAEAVLRTPVHTIIGSSGIYLLKYNTPQFSDSN